MEALKKQAANSNKLTAEQKKEIKRIADEANKRIALRYLKANLKG
jgi:predicted transglutaminase-like cysteine proteinase